MLDDPISLKEIETWQLNKAIIINVIIKDAGRFREDSDIDIAVGGLPKKLYFKALARLMMESNFEVDLKPIEDVSELLRQRIQKGKIIYEKRENP